MYVAIFIFVTMQAYVSHKPGNFEYLVAYVFDDTSTIQKCNTFLYIRDFPEVP
jgi:hypothetical protein